MEESPCIQRIICFQDDFSFSEPIDDVIIERLVESPLASENTIFGTSDEVTVTALNFSPVSLMPLNPSL